MDGSADPLGADLEDLEFEKRETRRLIREGRVTINHYYYMSKTPEAKPEQIPKQEPPKEPVQNPVQEPIQARVQEPVQARVQEPFQARVQEPVQARVPIPVRIPVENPIQKPRNNTFAHSQRRIFCTRCNKWYFEKDNVPHEDGWGPCRIHTGMFRPSREPMTLPLTICYDSF